MAPSAIRIDPLADPRWSALLAAAPEARVFHHPAWLELLAAQYGYAVGAVAIAGEDGALQAGLPFCRVASRLTGTRLVALPFSDLCPPLAAAGTPPAALAALGAALQRIPADEGLDLEVRGEVAGAPAAGAGPRFLHHELDLTAGADAVLAAAHTQHRRGIRRAEREGVRVVRRTDRAGLDRFYRLHAATRRRQGVPVQPRSFIRRFEGLFDRGLGHVLLAEHAGGDAAAAVFVGFGGSLIYKYGASDPSCLGARPNHAIFAEAIRWGAEQGHRVLDFGRTDLDNPGLAAFKSNWGAVQRELAYVRLPPRAARGDSGPGLARRAAGSIIRRSPPVVGRAVGAALYRHFG